MGHTLHSVHQFGDAGGRVAEDAVRFRDGAEADDDGVRYGVLCDACSPNIGSRSWRGCPVEIDVASEFRYREAPMPQAGWRCSCRSRVRRPTRWPRCAIARMRPAHRLGRERAGSFDRARVRDRVPDTCRARARRRVDEGLHLSAVGAGVACDRRRPRARRTFARARDPPVHARSWRCRATC